MKEMDNFVGFISFCFLLKNFIRYSTNPPDILTLNIHYLLLVEIFLRFKPGSSEFVTTSICHLVNIGNLTIAKCLEEVMTI